MILSILDVGHGNAAVLQDTGKVVVVDAGPGTVLREFLLQEEIKRVDLLIISHADADHINGATALIVAGFPIGAVRLNSDAEKRSTAWENLLWEIKVHKIDFIPALTTSLVGGIHSGRAKIEIMAPNSYLAAKGPGSEDKKKGGKFTANSVSAVIRILLGDLPIVVLAGDIDRKGLEYFDAEKSDAPILVFPHHGGRPGGNIQEFVRDVCDRFSPETIVFSVGRNRKGFPRKDIIDELTKYTHVKRVICTQLSEACAASLSYSACAHLGGKYAAGRTKSACCGGTVEITYKGGEITIHPEIDCHRKFISDHAPTALCACFQ